MRDLGSENFTWGDLDVIIRQAPRFSALYRSMNPDEYEWGLPEQLLALQADYLAVLTWQNGGGKKADYPDQIERPGVVPNTKKYGKGALPYDEMAAWLGWS